MVHGHEVFISGKMKMGKIAIVTLIVVAVSVFLAQVFIHKEPSQIKKQQDTRKVKNNPKISMKPGREKGEIYAVKQSVKYEGQKKSTALKSMGSSSLALSGNEYVDRSVNFILNELDRMDQKWSYWMKVVLFLVILVILGVFGLSVGFIRVLTKVSYNTSRMKIDNFILFSKKLGFTYKTRLVF